MSRTFGANGVEAGSSDIFLVRSLEFIKGPNRSMNMMELLLQSIKIKYCKKNRDGWIKASFGCYELVGRNDF